MSCILVTGCNGFIGSELTQSLLEKGYKVIGLSASKKSKVREHANFKYISIDITKCIDVEEIFKENEISTVIHLAAIAHTSKKQIIDWNTYYRINTLASKNIFEIAAREKANIVFVSTVDVYGMIEDDILTENSVPNPVSNYGKSKYLAENILMNFAKDKEFAYVIPRLTPVYGKVTMNDIYKRIYIKYPKIAFVIGHGLEYQFVSVKNVVDFITTWIESSKSFTGIVNVRDEKPINAKDFINFEKRNGNAKQIVRLPILLFKGIKLSLNIICRITKNLKLAKLSVNIYKLINPSNYSVENMKKVVSQEWDLEKTVYVDENENNS